MVHHQVVIKRIVSHDGKVIAAAKSIAISRRLDATRIISGNQQSETSQTVSVNISSSNSSSSHSQSSSTSHIG
jgi:hypothetical protein